MYVHPKFDHTGKTFGCMTVEEPIGHRNLMPTYKCRCVCGKEYDLTFKQLSLPFDKKCHCESIYEDGIFAYDRLHNIWNNMKGRCYNPFNNAYKYYGNRGIGICDDWKKDFSSFASWALANGYNPHLSIDRIDNNGPYSPENCRWANATTQYYNKRTIAEFRFNGEDHTLQEWSYILGIPLNILKDRIYSHYWPIEIAFSVNDIPEIYYDGKHRQLILQKDYAKNSCINNRKKYIFKTVFNKYVGTYKDVRIHRSHLQGQRLRGPHKDLRDAWFESESVLWIIEISTLCRRDLERKDVD